MNYHKSTAHVPALLERRWTRRCDVQAISDQFRFIVRLAAACEAAGVDYNVSWKFDERRASATIEALGDIPPVKRICIPREKPAIEWKPRLLDASYRLDFIRAGKDYKPGHVIEHSCGLALTRIGESESGDIECKEASDDPKKGWSVTHSASGFRLGNGGLSFAGATKLLMAAIAQPIDWHKMLTDWTPEERAAGKAFEQEHL